MTEPPFGSASPVFSIDGETVRELARDCIRLEISEGVEGLRTLRGHFIAVGGTTTGPPGPLLHLDGRRVDFGRNLKVSLGAGGARRQVFDGAVSALEAVFGDAEPPLAVLHAEDALMRLRMTRRMRTYTRMTDADIARALAEEHGLKADAAVKGPRYDVVQQLNQSDLAFLRERACLVQAELWCTGEELHFRTRDTRGGTTIPLVHGTQLLSVRIRADLAHQRGSAVVTGYDAARERVINEEAGPGTVDAEITGGLTGPRILNRAFGGTASYRVRETALTPAEAAAWARAEMLRRSRSFVTAHGTTRGTPDLTVGSRLTLGRVGAPFDGPGYYVTRVTHTFDNIRGFRTRFEAERPTLNEVS